MESTEGYQNKALVGKEAPSVCGATEIVCQFYGSSVKCVDWRIKAYALAGYDCTKSDGLTLENKLQDKMQKRQIDAMSVH